MMSILLMISFCAVLKAGYIERSKLFHRHVDPESGVVSYIMNDNVFNEQSKSLYFTNKSMTNDGRFIIVRFANNEARNHKLELCTAAVDLKTSRITVLIPGKHTNPFLDPDTDIVYYNTKDGFFKRELLTDPEKEIKICGIPKELTDIGPVKRLCTHLILNKTRDKAFLDTHVGERYVYGIINFNDGSFDYWGEVDFCLDHGAINPVRDDIALAAHESDWKDSKGTHKIQYINGIYPRLQLLEKGRRTMVPHLDGHKSYHECWAADGEGFYYCEESVYYHDLRTGEITKVSPMGIHPNMTADLKYVVSDQYIDNYYRGHAWRVYFWNRETQKGIFVHTYCPPIATVQDPSNLHPDPHPQFVCNDKYIVCTRNGSDGNMHFSVTPVRQLVRKTSR